MFGKKPFTAGLLLACIGFCITSIILALADGGSTADISRAVNISTSTATIFFVAFAISASVERPSN